MATKYYYSPNDKIAFWVVGYSDVDNSDVVDNMIERLDRDRGQFMVSAGIPPEERRSVKTYQVTKSRFWDRMRVYYAKMETAPEGYFTIGAHHKSMFQFISDS